MGLIPLEAYDAEAEWVREIPDFDPEAKVLERGCNIRCRGRAIEKRGKTLRSEQKLRKRPNLRALRSSKPQVSLASGVISGKMGCYGHAGKEPQPDFRSTVHGSLHCAT